MPFKVLREFLKYESSGGAVLFLAAILAFIVDNSFLHPYYYGLFHTHLMVKIGQLSLDKPLLLWINDGLMAIFFLLVGLEVKREMIEGELNSFSKATLPAIAAVGGIAFPALIYVYLNQADAMALRGWAIPTATDIAFSLGILAILGSRVSPSLKIFLTALAIFDDIAAILIIAVFYSKSISLVLLVAALLLIGVLFLLNRYNVTKFGPYFVIGTILWVCVLKSGVHATLSGIVLALAIPLRDKKNPEQSPLRDLEHKLHPWVAFGVLPLFAFANAGVSFAGLSVKELLGTIPLGIALGLFVGKQLGIWSFSMLAIRCGIAKMPKGATAVGIYGVGMVAGVGFTMSLFIGSLAFGDYGGSYNALVRLGVIVGSILSGVLGYIVLHTVHNRLQPHSLE